nr:hypothetical protein BaRGS_014322 [Batillaria attramentaria]
MLDASFLRPHRYTNFPHAQNDTSVRLRIHEAIGEGNFGRVFRGESKNILVKDAWTDVAIKMCKEDATDAQREDLMKETQLLSQIPRHKNIVTFLGSTMTSGITMLIVEFVNGPNLLHFLRKHRPRPGESQSTQSLFTWQELASLGLQVARGMEHLATFKVTLYIVTWRRRNVFVDENRVCKICDFGLARLLPEDNVYERKSKIFCIICSACPWPKMSARDVIARVLKGELLPKPDHCSDEIYSIMQDCWKQTPSSRPTFSQLRGVWETMLENDGDYLQMEHIDYEMYSALEPSSSTSTIDDDADDDKDDGAGPVHLTARRSLQDAEGDGNKMSACDCACTPVQMRADETEVFSTAF